MNHSIRLIVSGLIFAAAPVDVGSRATAQTPGEQLLRQGDYTLLDQRTNTVHKPQTLRVVVLPFPNSTGDAAWDG